MHREGSRRMVTNCARVSVYGSPYVRRGYHCMRITGLSESSYKYGNAAAEQQPHTPWYPISLRLLLSASHARLAATE